ncbi:MAG: hypothetical protein FGM24_02780 [Candidatus Kapabacteria bacterium]|nr:hypothetical protein [Candidatus Kapabacteria bacterium]
MRTVIIFLVILFAGMSASAQRFPLPWILQSCQTPYAPYGTSARAILDSMLYGGAKDMSYDVVDGDTMVTAKVSPKARALFYTKAEDGLYKIVITMQFQSELEAQRQLDVSMLELRKWYDRQVHFRMYDEEHLQRCGSEAWHVSGRAGKKYGLLNTFKLTFDRRQPK